MQINIELVVTFLFGFGGRLGLEAGPRKSNTSVEVSIASGSSRTVLSIEPVERARALGRGRGTTRSAPPSSCNRSLSVAVELLMSGFCTSK